MTRGKRDSQRPPWSGRCEECDQPLTAIRRETTADGERVTYLCTSAWDETEPWPHVKQRRWKAGHRHTERGLQTWTIETDATGLPRPGTMIVAYQGPPLPPTEEEATAADERRRQVLSAVYGIILRAADRASSERTEASGED